MDYSLLIGLHNLSSPPTESQPHNQLMNDYIFYRDCNGGYQATFEDNSPGPEVYYLGTSW